MFKLQDLRIFAETVAAVGAPARYLGVRRIKPSHTATVTGHGRRDWSRPPRLVAGRHRDQPVRNGSVRDYRGSVAVCPAAGSSAGPSDHRQIVIKFYSIPSNATETIAVLSLLCCFTGRFGSGALDQNRPTAGPWEGGGRGRVMRLA